MKRWTIVKLGNKNVPDFIKDNSKKIVEITQGNGFLLKVRMKGDSFELTISKGDRYEVRRIDENMMKFARNKGALFVSTLEEMIESYKEWS